MAPLRNAGTRQDTWVLRLTVDGESFGVWDKKTGGEVDSEDNKYYPGAMAQQVSLGGRKTTGNVTIQRLYDRIDDHDRINTLLAASGRGTVTLSQRPMTPDGVEYGRPIVYQGKLKKTQPPDVDSESSTAALVELELSISGYPSAV
jgi:hypothetical protein